MKRRNILIIAVTIWQAVSFHIYMGLDTVYLPVVVLSALSAGLLLAGVLSFLPERTARIAGGVITAVFGLIFQAECLCKTILQQYYQLIGGISTAAGNHLGDYRDAVAQAIVERLGGLFLFLLIPLAAYAGLSVCRGRKHERVGESAGGARENSGGVGENSGGAGESAGEAGENSGGAGERAGGAGESAGGAGENSGEAGESSGGAGKNSDVAGSRKRGMLYIILAAAVHLLMCAVIFLFPWKGDFTPDRLYQTDLYTDDQVEQLGLLNMLRLDLVHAAFGTEGEAAPKIRENAAAEETSGKPEEIRYDYNSLDIDFEALRASAQTDGAAWLSEYFDSLTPAKQNEYTGMFEGYNVIFLTAEGFSGYLIDPERTPTLYKMSTEGFVFDNFYSTLHFTSTSGGEFQNLTGLYPKAGFPISLTETGVQGTWLPFTLANSLNELGYTSIGYHFNENMYGRELSHPNLGYEWRQASECSRPLTKETDEYGDAYWPQSDDYMIRQTFDDYVDKQPFNIYYLTISAHLPYGYYSNQMSQRNWDAVAELPCSDKTKAYLAANLELEKGLTALTEKLEEAGIADKTVIVMAPDHIPYSDADILEELAGRTFGAAALESLDEQNVDMDIYRNTWILWSAGMEEPVHVEKTCSQVDILPTLLNLLGVEYDSRMLAGVDVMSEAEPIVICFSNSWRTDRGTYDRYTGVFQPAEGENMSEEEINVYVENIKYIVDCRLRLGQLIIENDYYRQAVP